MSSRKTYNVDYELYLKIERAAVEITIKTGKPVKWTELVKFTLERYLVDARADMSNPKLYK
ncbi:MULTISPECIES: hypothetical protein [Citrobacter]|uniref:hypothetical protein n=1 Tax=Citrobacter TaxID=544 RepID=UPI000A1225F2|nr:MULTISPECIES: hypothetical protein [Citrobacter]MBY6245954.1 hypothetical protein [Citrobacter werkmanii]NBD83985.1 hypothetical protein [Citrobacter werkmanii]ORT76782.1 hypothetical protein BO998_08395 [Citrobacter werkmanii]OSP18942.1 hypothetical protein B6S66_14960 [Citrobacter werkmanii]UQX61571.1 hypothetical protein M4I31_11850 [Citrobacter sp. XT1-2-2]